jgi:hypothetical protein
MNFPLYQDLLKLVKHRGKSEIDIMSVCNTIKQLESKHLENIFILILHHDKVSNKKNSSYLPYKGKQFNGNKGIHFELCNLDGILQAIIAEYVQTICKNVSLV